MNKSEYADGLADAAQQEAETSTLENVRERALRSEQAFRKVAATERRAERRREDREHAHATKLLLAEKSCDGVRWRDQS